MKLVKIGIVAVIVILVLNKFGLLSPNFSKTVDNTSEYVKEKAIAWDKSPFAKELKGDVLKTLITNVSPVNFENKGEGSYSIRGEQLTGTYYSKDPKSLEISFDATNTTSVRQAETVISLFKGEKFTLVPEQIKGLTNVKVKVSRVNNQFKMESNVIKF